MATVASYGRPSGHTVERIGAASVDEQRLDPKLEQLTSGAAPADLPSYTFIGLPICFMIALGIIMIGFRGAFTIESMAFFGLGALGILLVRYLNRRC